MIGFCSVTCPSATPPPLDRPSTSDRVEPSEARSLDVDADDVPTGARGCVLLDPVAPLDEQASHRPAGELRVGDDEDVQAGFDDEVSLGWVAELGILREHDPGAAGRDAQPREIRCVRGEDGIVVHDLVSSRPQRPRDVGAPEASVDEEGHAALVDVLRTKRTAASTSRAVRP